MNRQSRFNAGYRKLGAGALGWSRGMVWGGKWEGGFRIGNTCTPMADACWCMAKPIQYCKVKKKKKIFFQRLKFKKKKRERNFLCLETINIGHKPNCWLSLEQPTVLIASYWLLLVCQEVCQEAGLLSLQQLSLSKRFLLNKFFLL